MVAQREDVEHIERGLRRSEVPLSGTLRTRPTAPFRVPNCSKILDFQQ